MPKLPENNKNTKARKGFLIILISAYFWKFWPKSAKTVFFAKKSLFFFHFLVKIFKNKA